jgi:hypothetical protein
MIISHGRTRLNDTIRKNPLVEREEMNILSGVLYSWTRSSVSVNVAVHIFGKPIVSIGYIMNKEHCIVW